MLLRRYGVCFVCKRCVRRLNFESQRTQMSTILAKAKRSRPKRLHRDQVNLYFRIFSCSFLFSHSTHLFLFLLSAHIHYSPLFLLIFPVFPPDFLLVSCLLFAFGFSRFFIVVVCSTFPFIRHSSTSFSPSFFSHSKLIFLIPYCFVLSLLIFSSFLLFSFVNLCSPSSFFHSPLVSSQFLLPSLNFTVLQ